MTTIHSAGDAWLRYKASKISSARPYSAVVYARKDFLAGYQAALDDAARNVNIGVRLASEAITQTPPVLSYAKEHGYL